MSGVVWSLRKRIAFRFGFCLAVLYVYPAPFGYIPKTETVAEWLGKPWEWLSIKFCELTFGETPVIQQTGSGDTLFAWTSFLLMLILAAVACAVWSALDRKRLAYPRLATATWIGLRYVLAFTLFGYGFAKIINTQFPAPSFGRLDQRIGDMSPMGMLWTFQGSSHPYTIFGGLCEALAATLLLWRRTATLGAIVAIGVMTNVVMLNFCYDVPVKLFSMQLLVMAVIIAMPQLKRLTLAVFGHAVSEVPPRVRSSARVERLRLVAKIFVLAVLVYSIRESVTASRAWVRSPNELVGIWKVDTFSDGGVEVLDVVTNDKRWCKLLVTEWGVRAKSCGDVSAPLLAEVLPAAQGILVTNPQTQSVELWHYRRNGDHLVIDAGRLHVTLTRAPAPLLVTRGFHWVQELPFNR